jgi:hypothetical protein
MPPDLRSGMRGGIDRSGAVLVVATPEYQASVNCRFELSVLLEFAHCKPFVVEVAEANPRNWAAPEFSAVLRLDTQLYADLSAAAAIDSNAADAPALIRSKLVHCPNALPKLVQLLHQSRTASATRFALNVSGVGDPLVEAASAVSQLFAASTPPSDSACVAYFCSSPSVWL